MNRLLHYIYTSIPNTFLRNAQMEVQPTTTTSEEPKKKRRKLVHHDNDEHNHRDLSLLNPKLLKILIVEHGAGLLTTRDLGRLLLCTSKELTKTVEDGVDEEEFIWKHLCRAHWGKDLADQHLAALLESPKSFFLTSALEPDRPSTFGPRPLKYKPSDYQLFVEAQIRISRCNCIRRKRLPKPVFFSKVFQGSDIPEFFEMGEIDIDFADYRMGPLNLDKSISVEIILMEKLVLKRRDPDSGIVDIILCENLNKVYTLRDIKSRRFVAKRYGLHFTVFGRNASCNNDKLPVEETVEMRAQHFWQIIRDEASGNYFLQLSRYYIEALREPDGCGFPLDSVTFAHVLEALPKRKNYDDVSMKLSNFYRANPHTSTADEHIDELICFYDHD